MKTTSAGTIESMDCLVTVSEGSPGSGVTVAITGSSAARFSTAMKKTVLATAQELACSGDMTIAVQDNGALDLVLAARTKAAVLRFTGGAA
ncbi:MAG TPA: citrate lyase ACP [Synergistaceae bacterium]|nr:citrate lyase ACP [Synergistaceae bacterium]HPJ25251.1 citrate lyase ACP [Synergistaceae bacterium]HPQ37788.1 citrate lyase ACP [Synergistaceae bacterium]